MADAGPAPGHIFNLGHGIEKETDPDVAFVFLPGIDRVSHWLWGNLEPAHLYPEPLRPNPEERAGGAEALRVYYEYTDRLIGLLSAEYGPDDLVLFGESPLDDPDHFFAEKTVLHGGQWVQ